MSVLIKGMEMPDSCTRCDYLGLNVVIGCPVMSGINGRAADCPLEYVPTSHGQLIDKEDYRTHMSGCYGEYWEEVLDQIGYVIDAEYEEGE